MSFFNSMNISSSGLTVQRLRMDLISQNIANVDTTRTEKGTPYRRKSLIVQEKAKSFKDVLDQQMGMTVGSGVESTKIIEDQSDFKLVYEPNHPDADEKGYVKKPNVDIVKEMVNMISANRSYEANITAMNTSKSMAMQALKISSN